VRLNRLSLRQGGGLFSGPEAPCLTRARAHAHLTPMSSGCPAWRGLARCALDAGPGSPPAIGRDRVSANDPVAFRLRVSGISRVGAVWFPGNARRATRAARTRETLLENFLLPTCPGPDLPRPPFAPLGPPGIRARPAPKAQPVLILPWKRSGAGRNANADSTLWTETGNRAPEPWARPRPPRMTWSCPRRPQPGGTTARPKGRPPNGLTGRNKSRPCRPLGTSDELKKPCYPARPRAP